MDMLDTITPKSDQLNADDLIGRTLTITVRDVKIAAGEDQPVSLFYEGDKGKPFKACKSMRRVLVHVWGADAKAYIGRSMTLYRDPNVKFGGAAVGGIRISHMTHLDREVVMALTDTRASRKPYTVKPLRVDPATQVGAPIPAALTLLDPTFKEVTAKNVSTWVGWCETAISKIENAANMAKWRADMAPHFLAAERADRRAVDHVQKLADERMDLLAQRPPQPQAGDDTFPGDRP